MANCELGECKGDPKYTTPIVVPGLPNSGDGGGHEFVTELPERPVQGVEYIVMTDVADCETFVGSYVWDADGGCFVSTAGSGGGGAVERYTFVKTATGWQAKRNNTVIFTYVDKDTIDSYEDTADGFQIIRGGSVIFTHVDKGSGGGGAEYTAESTATGWQLLKDGVVIFTYTDKNDEYTITGTENGWVFKENGVVKFTYTESNGDPSDGTYFASGTLTTTIGGTTTVAASSVTGLVLDDVVIGETLIYDEFGSLGRVIAVSGSNLTVETVTTAPGERRGTRLGTVQDYTDLPATCAAASALGWQSPLAGDFAYVREDSSHTDHLCEYVITSIDSSCNITWAYSHTLNSGNYVVDIYKYGDYPSGNPIAKNADGSVTLPKDEDTKYDFEVTTDAGGNTTGWKVKDHETSTVLFTYTDQNDNDNTTYDFEDVTVGGDVVGWRVKDHDTGVILYTHTDVGDTTYDFENVVVGGEVVGWRVKDGDTGTVLYTYNDRSDMSDGSYLTSDTLSTTITGTTSVPVGNVSGLTVTDVIDGETLIYDGAGTVGVVTAHTSTTLTVSTMTISGSGDASSFVYTTTEELPSVVGSTQTLTRTALKRSDDGSVPALADLIVGKTLVSDKFGSVAVITDITGTTITGTVVTVAGGGMKAGVTWADAKLASDWTASAGTIPFVNKTGSTISQPANGQWTIPAGMTVHIVMSLGLMGSGLSNGEWGVREVGSANYILRVDPYDHSGGSGWALNGTASGVYTNTSSTDKVIYAECIQVQQACKIYAVTSQITVVEVARSGANIIAADDVYSTDEQLVGSYLGKPMYKKSFDVVLDTSGKRTINDLPSTIDKFVKIEGTCIDTAGWTIIAGTQPQTGLLEQYFSIVGGFNPANALWFSYGNLLSGQTAKVTCYYTKTTDAANSAPNKNSLLLTRPDLWTPGTEYDFGGGLYGKRFTGSASVSGGGGYEIILSGIPLTGNVINFGGWRIALNGNKWAVPGSMSGDFFEVYRWASYGWYAQVSGGTGASGTRQYDIWVTYTKS